MDRLTFDGNFCDIAQCASTLGGSFCENGSCSQRKVWERLKYFEDAEEQGRLIESELGCSLDVFWKVYRKLSGHGVLDHNLYALGSGKITQIKPETIMSGTYSNYPQDCSFTYTVWDSQAQQYLDTHSYYHFHDYGIDWFLTRQEAEKVLEAQNDTK